MKEEVNVVRVAYQSRTRYYNANTGKYLGLVGNLFSIEVGSIQEGRIVENNSYLIPGGKFVVDLQVSI